MLPSPTHFRGTVLQQHSYFATEELGNRSAKGPRATSHGHLCKLGAQNTLLLIGRLCLGAGLLNLVLIGCVSLRGGITDAVRRLRHFQLGKLEVSEVYHQPHPI